MPSRRSFLAALAAPSVLAADPRRRADGLEAAFAPRSAAAAPTGLEPQLTSAWPENSDPRYWDFIRDQFYIPRSQAYFNTGTIGAVPRPVLERVIEDMRTLAATLPFWDYSPRTPDWISGYSAQLPLRKKLGKLVNAEASELAVIQNATTGMNFLAQGLDLKAGDEIITTDREHPGGVCGWQLRAKRDSAFWKQAKIPVPANDPDEIIRLFAAQITPRTRVLSFPHIISSTAVVMPVKRLTDLAHEHGCLAIVDGAHGVGQVEVDLHGLGCDAYFSSPHKWLLAPAGNGMLYIRADRQDLFWTTLCSSEWDDHKQGMYRFMQYGTGNPSLLVGLDAALDFHFRIGPERVRARIRSLADRLRAGLQQIPGVQINSPVQPEMAGAIVVYSVRGVHAADVEEQIWEQRRMRPRSVGDPLGVRQSCHICNSEAEIDATLEIVSDLAKQHA
jgi:isopenicillin-N epimerase